MIRKTTDREVDLTSPAKVLVIANDFPPVGGAGVQRSVYFVRYLGAYGWRPVVLTVKDVAFPAKDPTLLAQLPEDVRIVRTESFELRRLLWLARRLRGRHRESDGEDDDGAPSEALGTRSRDLALALRRWLFVPDDRMLWAPFAVPIALRLIRREPIDVIYATLPSYSSGVIGQVVSRLTGRPLVVDLRDPWTMDPYSPAPSPVHAHIDAWMESSTLRWARRVIATTPRMRSRLIEAYPNLSPERFVTITNGYDPGELDSVIPWRPPDGRFAMVYAGSLYTHHRAAFVTFCDAWSQLCESNPAFAEHAELVLVGRCDAEILQELAARPSIRTSVLHYRPHAEALRYLLGSSALLLLIKDLDPKRDMITIPGKLFEYAAAGSPILMVGPEGDAAEIVRRAGGRVHPQSEGEAIRDSLAGLFEDFRAGISRTPPLASEVVSAYDRRHLTAQLAAELSAVTGKGRAATAPEL